MTKISACIVIYHEEKLLERCIDSCKNLVDEIIVVHDGKCHDKSISIAKKLGAKVFERERIGIAEPHRPFTFTKATGDWILQLDADEFLSKKMQKKLQSLVQDPTIDAYSFKWPTWNGQKYVDWDYKPCLFRKSKMHMLGLPQHVAFTSGTMKKSDLVLEHKPLNHSFVQGYLKKQDKWAEVHARWLLKDFKKIPVFQITQKDWSRSHYVKQKLAFLYPIVGVLIFLWLYVVKGKIWRSGGFKNSLIGAYYNFRLYQNLSRLK